MKTLCSIIDREYYDCLDSYVNIFLLCHCIRGNGEDNGKDLQKHHIHMKELEQYFCYTSAHLVNCTLYVIEPVESGQFLIYLVIIEMSNDSLHA